MTIDGELRAVRAVARRLRDNPDARSLPALASALEVSAKAVDRSVTFLRAEADGKLPDELPGGYEGLTVEQVTGRFASRCAAIAATGGTAGDLLAERRAFLDALNAVLSTPRGRAGALSAPDAAGPGAVGRDAARTSRAAALAVEPKTGTQRRRILDALYAVSRDPRSPGLTDVDLARLCNLSPNSERPRRVELVQGGWVEDTGRTRTHHGAEHVVWALTAHGAATLNGGKAPA